MFERVLLFVLDRAAQAGAIEACQSALKGYDPLVRWIVFRRARRAQSLEPAYGAPPPIATRQRVQSHPRWRH